MIDYIIPLPNRTNLLGNVISGLADGAGILNDAMRTVISREVAVLPFYFYKIHSTWGNLECEHIVASDRTDVNLLKPQGNMNHITPICVKMKQNGYTQIPIDTTYLFAKGIDYLLTKYPKTSSLDSTPQQNRILAPLNVTGLMGFSEWFVRMANRLYYNPNGFYDRYANITTKTRGRETLDMCDPIWGLVKEDAGTALAIANLIASASFCKEDLASGFDAVMYDAAETQKTDIKDIFLWEFHEVKNRIDPITLLFLNSPWYSMWDRLSPFIPLMGEQQRSGWINVAMQQANNTINYDGIFLPFTIGDNSDWTVYRLISILTSCNATNFVVEVNGGCRPRIAVTDLLGYQGDQYYKSLGDNIGSMLCEMFIGLRDTSPFIKGHSVTLSKTLLDEVFIVVEGNFGKLCYYLSLPHYFCVSPVLCNVFVE